MSYYEPQDTPPNPPELSPITPERITGTYADFTALSIEAQKIDSSYPGYECTVVDGCVQFSKGKMSLAIIPDEAAGKCAVIYQEPSKIKNLTRINRFIFTKEGVGSQEWDDMPSNDPRLRLNPLLHTLALRKSMNTPPTIDQSWYGYLEQAYEDIQEAKNRINHLSRAVGGILKRFGK